MDTVNDLVTVTTKVLHILATADTQNGVLSDADLKDALDVDDETNLGPRLATLSKDLKRAGLDKDAVYKRHSKRGLGGRMFYWYRLTDQAKEAVLGIDDFLEPISEFTPPVIDFGD